MIRTRKRIAYPYTDINGVLLTLSKTYRSEWPNHSVREDNNRNIVTENVTQIKRIIPRESCRDAR